MTSIDVRWLGRTEYLLCEAEQVRQRASVIQGTGADTLLCTEHASVYVYGRRQPSTNDFPDPEGSVKEIPVVRSKRGGLLTYHGPGQLMVYCIVDIKRRQFTIPQFVDLLQDAVIEWLHSIGVKAHATPGCPGVWVGDAKICSVGLHFRSWVSMYGLSVNLDPDLTYFRNIRPCGFSGERVTSIREQGGQQVAIWHAWRDLSAVIVREIEANTVDKESR